MNIQFHGFLFLSHTKTVKLETSSQVILKPLFSKSWASISGFFLKLEHWLFTTDHLVYFNITVV